MMTEQEKYNWLVCTRCFTFNHASYIVDAMNGFTMQQTDFPFVCTIVDDASTDGEQEVIKKYLQEHFNLEDRSVVRNEETDDYFLTYAQHKTNKNCFFAVLYLKYNHYSIKKSKFPYISEWYNHAKYIALCEGDDYWISPVKLQHQYDFMKNNPDYTLCATNALTLWDHGLKPASYFNKFYETHEVTMDEIIGNWMFATATLFYKKSVRENYPEWTKKVYSGDMTLLLIAAHKGKISVISDLTAIYRKAVENNYSITNNLSNRMDYVKSQQIILYKEFQKWTDFKYKEKIEKTITKLEKFKKYFYYRQKSRVLPYIMMPIFTIRFKLKKK